MSRAPWIHVDRLPAEGESLALDRDETRHAARARRLGPGDAVVLTDGAGTTARAEIVAAGKREARARVIELIRHEPDVPAIHLASALPKGDRLSTLLAMATQLGIASFTPLVCRHSVAVAGDEVPTRWMRILRESAKQSQRAHVPVVHPAVAPDALLAAAGCDAVWLMDPDAESTLWTAPMTDLGSHLVVVGPEGGLADDERRMLVSDGARPIRLGPGILRVETACVAGVAALRARFGP